MHNFHNTLFNIIEATAQREDVRIEVINNHDNNRWWPKSVEDWRMRIVFSGWSTRISYSMIKSFQGVIRSAEQIGFDNLSTMADSELADVVRRLGMASTRVKFFRSVQSFVQKISEGDFPDLRLLSNDDAISIIRNNVWGASYKVAQCSVLYVKGYHCGIFPVDSGMVSSLGPCLGLSLSSGDIAHEQMRIIFENVIKHDARRYRDLIHSLGYAGHITLPDEAAPTWWVHLVLIYFKRLYCNRHHPEQCPIHSDVQNIGSMCDRTHPKRGGMKYIIIEGADGVGKTSLLRKFSERGFNTAHFPYAPEVLDLKGLYDERISNLQEPQAWDRSFISEFVYGEALRGATRLSLDDCIELATIFSRKGGSIIYLAANAHTIQRRMQLGGRGGQFNPAQHASVTERYEYVMSHLASLGLAYTINTDNMEASNVIKKIESEFFVWRQN